MKKRKRLGGERKGRQDKEAERAVLDQKRIQRQGNRRVKGKERGRGRGRGRGNQRRSIT